MSPKTVISTIALVLAIAAIPSLAQFPESINASDFDGSNGFTVVGYLIEEFGRTVARLGDVNNDGIDDIASGGLGVYATPNCGCVSTPGAVYVVLGGSDVGSGGTWSAQELDETTGFRVEGLNPGDGTGFVAGPGDFDYDGIADLVVGALGASPNGILAAGEAYVIYGAPELGTGAPLNLGSLDGQNGFAIQGTNPLGGIGAFVQSIGDLNDDDVPDIGLGSATAHPNGWSNAGQIYVIFGGQGVGTSRTFVVPNDLTPSLGLIVNGASPGDVAARPAGAGDFNGDNRDDLIVLATGANSGQDGGYGRAYVIYGGADVGDNGVFELANVNGANGFVIDRGDNERFRSATGIGDINDDGYYDVAVAVDAGQFDGGDYIGVVFGGPDVAPNGVFCLADLNGTNGFKVIRVAGPPSSTGLPRAPGDLNHDGIDDLFVYLHGGQVIFGAPDIGASGVVAIDDLDGRFGFRPPTGGRDRSFAGDVNNDGIDDIIAGTVHYNELFEDIGKIDVVFGRRMGDGDLDADVDFADFGAFQACFGDPPDGDVPDECHPFDFDKDNTIGLTDFDAFQDAFGTPP